MGVYPFLYESNKHVERLAVAFVAFFVRGLQEACEGTRVRANQAVGSGANVTPRRVPIVCAVSLKLRFRGA